MKDYYKIIGVDRTASEADIKRSFRRLAIQYHPDKNPSSEAENLFKEINEAYAVLSDPVARFQYDQLTQKPTTSAPREPSPQRAYYRPRQPSDRMIFMQSMLRYVQILFYTGCLWTSLLLLDYLLPERVAEENVITNVSKNARLLIREHHDLLVTDKGHHFPVLLSEMRYFPMDTPLKIYTSSVFSALIRVENYNGTFVVNNLGTIYRNFCFAPLLLLVCCLVGLIWRKGIEFHVNLGIVVFILMILNIVFLYKSIL